jgi:hypothetical protein
VHDAVSDLGHLLAKDARAIFRGAIRAYWHTGG